MVNAASVNQLHQILCEEGAQLTLEETKKLANFLVEIAETMELKIEKENLNEKSNTLRAGS